MDSYTVKRTLPSDTSYRIMSECSFTILNQKDIIFNQYGCSGTIESKFQDEEKLSDWWFISDCAPHYDKVKGEEGNWLPNKIRTFNFINPTIIWGKMWGDDEKMYCHHYSDDFKRTPDEIYFKVTYKFISVDGEYAGEMKFDLMDEWKNCQKELGLR